MNQILEHANCHLCDAGSRKEYGIGAKLRCLIGDPCLEKVQIHEKQGKSTVDRMLCKKCGDGYVEKPLSFSLNVPGNSDPITVAVCLPNPSRPDLRWFR